MGCDDHSYLEWNEIGDKGDPFFEFVARIELGRFYGLYSIMAGVRSLQNDAPPLFPPRGLPEKLSMATERDYHDWVADAHHETWFNVDELRQVQERFEGKVPEPGGLSSLVLEAVISMMNILNGGDVELTRLIVWWDN